MKSVFYRQPHAFNCSGLSRFLRPNRRLAKLCYNLSIHDEYHV